MKRPPPHISLLPRTPTYGQSPGTAVKCVRGDCDALWTSRGFVEFCDSMGITRQHSPPGAQQYNGVAESAIQRCNNVGMASRHAALRRLGPEGFSCIKGMDPRRDRLWAESAKDAAQKLKQSASPSNPGVRLLRRCIPTTRGRSGCCFFSRRAS